MNTELQPVQHHVTQDEPDRNSTEAADDILNIIGQGPEAVDAFLANRQWKREPGRGTGAKWPVGQATDLTRLHG